MLEIRKHATAVDVRKNVKVGLSKSKKDGSPVLKRTKCYKLQQSMESLVDVSDASLSDDSVSQKTISKEKFKESRAAKEENDLEKVLS